MTESVVSGTTGGMTTNSSENEKVSDSNLIHSLPHHDKSTSESVEISDEKNIQEGEKKKLKSEITAAVVEEAKANVIGTSSSAGGNSNATSTSTNSNAESDTRLWIGNLDARLREYGVIDNFDFLFHRTGPNIGLPRGYAFVTFQDKQSAENCLKSLDGTKVLDKHVAVRWAHQTTTTFLDEETKLKSKLPALSLKKEESSEGSSLLTKEKKINAIEEKLKAMEREKEMGHAAGSSSNFFYHYNKDPPVTTLKSRPRPYERMRNTHRGRRPYRR